MALTDKQQKELYEWVREIHRELDPDRENSVANKVWKTNHAAGRIDAASRVQTEALAVLANGFNIDPGVLVEKIEEAINSIEVTLTTKGDKDD